MHDKDFHENHGEVESFYRFSTKVLGVGRNWSRVNPRKFIKINNIS